MFMGEYKHSIDSKGRLILPAKFREELGESFVVTRGLDNCLFIYPEKEWMEFDEKLQALPLINESSRKLNRFFHSGATLCEPDKQGRILIPQSLREHAGLDKEACLIGMGKKIEIWSKERWDENINAVNDDMDTVLANMEELGITI